MGEEVKGDKGRRKLEERTELGITEVKEAGRTKKKMFLRLL